MNSPSPREKIFLAHAGVCPLPRRVADAISECARQSTLGDQEAFVQHRLADAQQWLARRVAARPVSSSKKFPGRRTAYPDGGRTSDDSARVFCYGRGCHKRLDRTVGH